MVVLLPDQEQLLAKLVEAARGVPRYEQQFLLLSFSTDQMVGSIDEIVGPGLGGTLRVLGADVWDLARKGLLNASPPGRDGVTFTVSAEGFAHYEALRRREPEPAAALEQEVRRHLDGATFAGRYARLTLASEPLKTSCSRASRITISP